MQASTINVSISRLKKLYDYILNEKYIDFNPFCAIQRLKEQRKIIYPLNDCEIKQMLSIAKKHPNKHIAQRNTVLLMLMIECGLRISEVCQIIIKNSKNNKDRAVTVNPILKKENTG